MLCVLLLPLFLLLLLLLIVGLGVSLVALASGGGLPQPVVEPDAKPAEIVLSPRPPGDESTLRSPGSDVATSVRFENRTTRALDVHWLDFAGQRKRYASVEPGMMYTNNTYVGHVFVVAESSGEAVAIFVAETAPGLAIVA